MLSFSVPLGKLVRTLSRLRGGGSAFPGLVVEKIDPGFMQRTLASLPHGVAVVSGTNGKTTTTKMVVELLESQGLKVFTNRSGSNFTRGVAASHSWATWIGVDDLTPTSPSWNSTKPMQCTSSTRSSPDTAFS
jgi:hypothetical protein